MTGRAGPDARLVDHPRPLARSGMVHRARLLARSRAGGARSESGFTLLEVLLSMSIAALLLVPVGMWMVMAMRQQGPTSDRFSDAAQARIANTYLSRDVGSAELVRVDLADPSDPAQSCGDPVSSSVNDEVLMQLVDDTPEVPLRTVYVTSVDASGVSGVWRRTCATNDMTATIDDVRVLKDLDMSPGVAPSAKCAPVSEQDCTQVTFKAKLASGAPVNVRAMRRATLDPAFLGSWGNSAPRAVIDEGHLPRVPRNTALVLDSSKSSDSDGVIQSRTWTVSGPGVPASVSQAPVTGEPTQRSFTFTQLGTYQVQLEVSDGIDTRRTSVTIEVYNQDPKVELTVAGSAEGKVQGGAQPDPHTFTFSAAGSHDPEGTAITYDWDFGAGAVVLSGGGGPQPAVQYDGTDPLGDRKVQLTVHDSEGGSASAEVAIRLLGPDGGGGGPGPIPTGPVIVTTSGEPNGQLFARDGHSPRAGTVGPGREPVVVTFGSTQPAASDAWTLRHDGNVVETSTGASFSHTFGPDAGGEWTISVKPDGGVEATQPFRLNAAPVADFTWTTPGTAPTPVSFDPGGSHDDGSIVAYEWNLGFFEDWLSTDTSPTHTYANPGVYKVALLVTDDDGATTFTVLEVPIPGAIKPLAAGTFDGVNYSWAAVPGAEAYQVHWAASGCSSATTSNSSVPVSRHPSLKPPYPGCHVVASYKVRVAGQWSNKSPDTVFDQP